jgi:hypothetical protein
LLNVAVALLVCVWNDIMQTTKATKRERCLILAVVMFSRRRTKGFWISSEDDVIRDTIHACLKYRQAKGFWSSDRNAICSQFSTLVFGYYMIERQRVSH